MSQSATAAHVIPAAVITHTVATIRGQQLADLSVYRARTADVRIALTWGGNPRRLGGGRLCWRTGRTELFAEAACEIRATREPVLRSLSERNGQNRVEAAEFGATVGQRRWWHVDVARGDDHRVGIQEQLRTGQQMKRGSRQGILVGAAIHVLAQQLFRLMDLE